MRDLLTLVKVNLSEYMRFLSKVKNKLRISIIFSYILIISFYLLIMYGLYYLFSLLSPVFKDSECPQLIIAVVIAIVTIFTLIKSYMSANSFIFNTKDYERLFCLPIQPKIIVISKILSLYLYLLIFSMILIIPAYLTYVGITGLNFWFLIRFVIYLLLIPVVPMVLGTILKFALECLNATQFVKNILNALFYVALLGYFTIKFSTIINNFGKDDLVSVEYILDWFFNFNIFGKIGFYSIESDNYLLYLLYIIVSAASIIGIVYLLGYFYKHINNKMINRKNKHKTKVIKYNQIRGTIFVLLKKEIMIIRKIPTYLSKTLIGPIAALILMFILLYNDEMRNLLNQFLSAIGIYKRDEEDVIFFICQIIILLCYSMSTTSSSLSIEGDRFWVLKTLPVKWSTIIIAKILVNVILSLPLLLITALILYFKLSPSINVLMYGYSVIVLYIISISILGMYFDVKHPRLNAESYGDQINKGRAITLTTVFSFVIVAFIALITYTMYEIVSMSQMMKYELALCFACFLLVLVVSVNGIKKHYHRIQ